MGIEHFGVEDIYVDTVGKNTKKDTENISIIS